MLLYDMMVNVGSFVVLWWVSVLIIIFVVVFGWWGFCMLVVIIGWLSINCLVVGEWKYFFLVIVREIIVICGLYIVVNMVFKLFICMCKVFLMMLMMWIVYVLVDIFVMV